MVILRSEHLHDAAEHGVDDDLGALLREAGDVGHLLDERRLRQAAVGHGDAPATMNHYLQVTHNRMFMYDTP